jgi:S1/P1 Nuclease/Metal binding domain of Ada
MRDRCVWTLYTEQLRINGVMLVRKRVELRQSSRSPALRITNVILAVLFCPILAWGWGNDGHEIVAIIAVDNLTRAAQSHVASILGVPTARIATAMEAASVRPDSEFREEDRSTAPWHFIDICLQDQLIDVPARCPGGNCVTGKIDEYSRRLKQESYDRWGAAGDLAFLIHFVGDIHQPLHTANDADRGGNCVLVDSQPPARNLHDVWDTAIVRRLEESIGTPKATARKLEQMYAGEKAFDTWAPGHTDDIAWESNQIARSDIYAALQIPVEPCDPPAALCSHEPEVSLNSAYMDHANVIAGHQLAKAGFRLANLLNEIWVQPLGPNDLTRAENSAPGQVLSSKIVAGQIVGNRRSKIYAWPRCGSYDRMAPQNRVVFPSRNAAEQAGYRAAYNCPRRMSP